MIWVLLVQLGYLGALAAGPLLVWTARHVRSWPWAVWSARVRDEISVRTAVRHHHQHRRTR